MLVVYEEECDWCDGSGEVDGETCPDCDGLGYVEVDDDEDDEE